MTSPEATRLVLASASPRRRELLALLGRPFEVEVAEVDEAPRHGEAPAAMVERLAMTKAVHVARARAVAMPAEDASELVVVGVDTVVVCDGEVFGKPATHDEAVSTIRRLQGRAHEVMTGVAVARTRGGTEPAVRSFVEVTEVWFAPMTAEDVEAYVATGEPLDKAGGYGIQGVGGRWVTRIEGSYHNVVGLPVAQLAPLLAD